MSWKALTSSETQIQQAAVVQIDRLAAHDERYASIYAIPNGGYGLPIQVAARLKREGLRKGYPDLNIDLAYHGFHGLRIEVKKPGGVPSPEQREWKARLELAGYAHGWCYSVDDVMGLIGGYLDSATYELFTVDPYRYGSERTRTGRVKS